MKKKILIIFISILVIGAAFCSGYFLNKCRLYSLKLNPGEVTSLVLGWQALLHGQIKEIGDNSLIVALENQTAEIKLSADSRFYDISTPDKLQNPLSINFQDLKVGDPVSVWATVFKEGLFASTISKISKEK